MSGSDAMAPESRTLDSSNRRMTELLRTLVKGEGIRPSVLDGVKFMRANRSVPRTPVLYEPSVVIVGQGRKRGYLGSQVYTYDAHNYLVLSVPMPFECETEVGQHGPLLAVSVQIEVAVLGELLMKMDRNVADMGENAIHGMSSTPLDLPLSDATVRLLECLSSPTEAKVLGPQIVREITYRVLCGRSGHSLRTLIALNGRVGQVQSVLQRMHMNYFEALEVENLAREAGMSVSAFHHNFKSVTATSPLQYLKTIRLHKARMLMVQEGVGAAVASERVGYASSSQFSREFKRFFGATPADEAERMRALLGFDEGALAPVH